MSVNLAQVISVARQMGSSDVHISVGLPVVYRINGQLQPAPFEVTSTESEAMIREMLQFDTQEALENLTDHDFAFTLGEFRHRANVYKQQGRATTAIRLLNQNKSHHVLTVEDPIEYVYEPKRSLIHQREVGKDVPSFAKALHSALREDPDAMLVGEMRDYETISAAVTAAETGHLVLSTLHTIGAAQTIDRVIDACPPAAQSQIRTQMSGILKGVITQQLIPRQDGNGRVVATEILVVNEGVAHMIRENKIHQLDSQMQSGAALGMHTLNSDLARLVREGIISRNSAYAAATNKKDLEQYLG